MNSYLGVLCLLFSFQGYAQGTHPSLRISHLTDNLYVYTTWGTADGTPFPANGLILVTRAGVALMDSPWDTTQFEPLLDTIYRRFHRPVVLCIATHFHEDRTAGLSYYTTKGIKTYTSALTDSLCAVHGKPRAEFLFSGDTAFLLGGYAIQTYYPGEGHTRDNIVVWFGRSKVLYGGCLVKSTEAADLGNIADGNLAAYAETIRRLQRKFPDAAYVVPGHQDWHGKNALTHTLDLALSAGSH